MKIDYQQISPQIDTKAFVAEGAKIIGDVTVGMESSIWYNCVLRGDVDSIIIGTGTNVQDATVIHTSRFNGKTIIGNNVTIGHTAIIHACKIMDMAFIGMGAIIMDNVIVEPYGFVAAGTLIPPGKIVKSYQLWAGTPGKLIRQLTEKEIFLIDDSYKHYVKLAKKHKNS